MARRPSLPTCSATSAAARPSSSWACSPPWSRCARAAPARSSTPRSSTAWRRSPGSCTDCAVQARGRVDVARTCWTVAPPSMPSTPAPETVSSPSARWSRRSTPSSSGCPGSRRRRRSTRLRVSIPPAGPTPGGSGPSSSSPAPGTSGPRCSRAPTPASHPCSTGTRHLATAISLLAARWSSATGRCNPLPHRGSHARRRPWRVRRVGPGADTDAVLAGLGLTPHEVARLRADGVVA